MPSVKPFQLLCGPLTAKLYQPFDRMIDADWHIVSGQSGGPTKDSFGEPVQTVSFELASAEHNLQQHVWPYLPVGWQPDLLLYLMPEYYLLAPDLPELACPVAVLIGDWYLGFERILANRSAFDFWITDSTAVPLFQQAGIDSIMGFPVFSLNLKKYQAVEVEAPIYDIGFAGNLRTDVHSRRAHYLYRLSLLSDRYQVKIATDLYQEDYIRFYKQCRLIFNYSIHGEFNMRCFEALGCQTLMLLETTNQEAPQFLRAGTHYVSYEFAQLEQVIAYYLSHEQERLQIARAGFDAIQQYGAQQTWLDLKQRLQALLEQGVIQRQASRQAAFDPTINRIYNVNPPFDQLKVSGEVLIQRLVAAPSVLDANNLGVLYYTLWLTETGQADSDTLKQAVHYFQLALELHPNYPLAAYNLAQIQIVLKNFVQAEAWLQTCLQNLDQAEPWPWGLVAYLYLDRSYEKFYQPWFMAAAQLEYAFSDPDELLIERKRLLKAYVYFYLGQVAMQSQQLTLAADYWESALKIGGSRLRQLVPEVIDLLRRLDQPFRALKLWAQGLGDPMNPALWLTHLQTLYLAEQPFLYGFWYPVYQQLLKTVPTPTHWQDLLDSLPVAELSSGEIFAHYGLTLDSRELDLDRLLTSWCGISWSVPIEPEPDFYGYLGLHDCCDHFHYGLSLSGDTQIGEMQRVYDQPSDLRLGRLGPDLLPCTFPTAQKDIQGLPERAWLVLLPAYSSPELVPLLQAVTEQADSNQALILWHPLDAPQAQEWEPFMQALSPFEDFNLSFYESLSLDEQAFLMNQVECLMGSFQGAAAYYLWWAKFLDKKTWMSSSAEHFPADWQTALDSGKGLESFWSQDAELRKKAALDLRYFMLKEEKTGKLWTDLEPHLNYLF